MKIEEGNFTDELSTIIKKRKIAVIRKLVNKLSSETEDEECLNATTVLNELIEVNDLFNIINHKYTIERLSQIAFDTETGNAYSRQAGKSVLEKLLQRINNRNSPSNDDDEDEDDKIKMQDSDENED